MSDDEFQIQLAAKDGEIAMLKQQAKDLLIHSECFIDQMWFWRRKYLNDHPEKDNWDYAIGAYSDETGKPSSGLCPPSQMHERQE